MKRLAMSVVFLLCLATPALSDELVVNGSFEQPLVPAVTTSDCTLGAANDWCYAPSDKVNGWTVEWTVSPTGLGNLEFWKVGNGRVDPQHLGQLVELDTAGRGLNAVLVRIHEDLTTCPNATYTFSYYYRPRPNVGTAQTLEVRWGGIVVATHGPFFSGTPLWNLASTSQTASSGSVRVSFEDIGFADSLGMLLDNVSVQGLNGEVANACSTINIKPNSDPNSINLGSGGFVPVIIWGSDTLDVTMIDPTLLTFASAQVKTVGKTDRALCSILDLGSPDPSQFDSMGSPDGEPDLICHFETQGILGLNDSSTEAEVEAVICPNGYFNGCDENTDPTITFTDAVNIVKE